MDSFFDACARHDVHTHELVHIVPVCLLAWGIRPSGPAKLNSDCQAFFPLPHSPWCLVLVRLDAISASAGEEQSDMSASGRRGKHLRRFDDGRLELIFIAPSKALACLASRGAGLSAITGSETLDHEPRILR